MPSHQGPTLGETQVASPIRMVCYVPSSYAFEIARHLPATVAIVSQRAGWHSAPRQMPGGVESPEL
jgi:hypothetical protein